MLRRLPARGLGRAGATQLTGPRLEEWGLPGGQAWIVVIVHAGRIVRIHDHPTRAAALAAAGLPPEPQSHGDGPEDDLTADPPQLRPDGPLARKVIEVIRSGGAAELKQLLDEHPGLAGARIGEDGGESRTLVHVVTDWPGHVPETAAKIRALVGAGADVDGRFTGPHTETGLHWAASSDDVEALDALLDLGADVEACGAVIGGGAALADAVAFGQWNAARRLLERGARANLWQAAALGLVDRVQEELDRMPAPAQPELDNALWCAAHGGQRTTAQLLLDRGADARWVGHDGLIAAAAAARSGAYEVAAWLRDASGGRDA